MKSSLAVCAAAGALSGCYVVPIDVAHPLPTGMAAQPAAAIVPATQPIPSVLHARLYPLNETAGKAGALSAVVSDNANGHATFSLNYAGELLQGEASRVSASYPGFGKIHREVYNQSGAMPTGQRGIASAAGSRGTYVNCEYALAAPNRGTGACIFSNGAKYQLHFGS